jgi:orotidine-5'-phosphate decarboxylase
MGCEKRIIVALDVSDRRLALSLVKLLAPHVGGFKVGFQLIHSVGGPQIIRAIQKRGGWVFYDCKLHDIPNTMAKSAAAIAKQNVWMFNFHASAGVAGMKAAVANRGSSLALAVTVLTSMDDEQCQQVYGKACAANQVTQFAHAAVQAGCDGIVCSPQELPAIKGSERLRHLKAVVPGVRPKWAESQDQKRVMTPLEAIRNGADFLVIGRPIIEPPGSVGSPVDAAGFIASEISTGIALRRRVLANSILR